MTKPTRNRRLRKFLKSADAIAIPVTFMILFVSMTLLVTVTYYISITQINSKTQDFKFSCAIQEMTSLEKVINFVAWSPGSYQVHTVEDYGGTLKVLPAEKTLTLTLNGSDGFEDTVFNGSIGMIDYVLPSTSIYRDNLFLEGDSRVLLNQSQATTDQVYLFKGSKGYEVSISYRPLAGSTGTDSDTGPASNTLKIYVVSFASSPSSEQAGEMRLKISCTDIATTWSSYNFGAPISDLTLNAVLDGKTGQVQVPITSSTQGATVNVEVLTCNLTVENVGWT
jgi:hypothetical protein